MERLTALRRYQFRSSSLRYAPHKPLLVLLALASLQQGIPQQTFGSIEEPMKALLRSYAPTPKGPLSADDPFWHLQRDGLWHIPTAALVARRADGRQPVLDSLRAAAGGLPPSVLALLEGNPYLLSVAVDLLLHTYFPPSLHDALRAQVGLVPPSVAVEAQAPVRWRETLRRLRVRDPAFRQRILANYGHACAVCGLDVVVDQQPVGLQAAHLQWHAYAGPDDDDNGLALCALHHDALDRGWLGLTDARQWVVSRRLQGGAAVQQLFGAFHQQPVRMPVRGSPVALSYIQWHRDQVFKSPAR